jgi:2-polyprenyl-3-methyl-5-hydroxy-6-metoxy-1,4-benzoquinol methylase
MAKQDFSRRSAQAELMDTELVTFAEFHDCLRDLESVNICTLAYRPTLRWLGEMLADAKPQQAVTILDIGSGGGDMLRRIWTWAHSRGLNADLTGVDLNPWSAQSAEQTTPRDMPIRFETSNIFSFDPARRADFIISSLFTHHLTDSELIRFIQWMDAHATRGWFINDLHRHPLPYYFTRYVFRLLRLNRLVQHDGPVSVARAYTASDYRRALAEAGIPAQRAKIEWFFPFRYGVSCRKS